MAESHRLQVQAIRENVHGLRGSGQDYDLLMELLGDCRFALLGEASHGTHELALAELRGPKKLEIIPGATHLFEEKGALESVAQFAKNWFLLYLVRANQRARTA